uniref:Ankyrin repeat and SOCS box containing 6 n=1 Tax=Zonotrichia albicollis TaxID=44394 RepID=A0A8D2MCZ2_ZONAL
MPFLHGFRRIVLEYQPLVDELLGLLATPETEGQSSLESSSHRPSVLWKFLERETHSPFYQEGVSYALLKVTELGLVPAAEILLEFGADLSFEDPVTYYTPLHVAVLRNQPDVVELLVQHGFLSVVQIHESSPLDLASEEPERLPCLERLLQLGADVNAADKNGADVRAATRDGDTVFTYVIYLLGEMAYSYTEEEAEAIERFCFRVTQLLLAHGANPSQCPASESLTHFCLKSFKDYFPLLRLLLESGAAYNCSLHGPSCWSGFHITFEHLCWHFSRFNDETFTSDLMQKAQTLLELMMASSQAIQLPSNFEVNTSSCRFHREKVQTLFCSVKQMEGSPQALKHLCRVFIRQRLKPWPVGDKIKALPLPDRLKWYLLIDHTAAGHEDL